MFSNLPTNVVAWAVLLMIATPLVTIFLGETIDRLRSRESAYTKFFEIVRALLLPVIVAVILAKFLFHQDEILANAENNNNAGLIYRLIISTFYVTLGYAAFVFLGAVKREENPKAWENRIPGLFIAILTIMIFVVPVLFLLNAWGVKVGNFAKFASIAVAATAFALQDALSSITKGFLLVLDKPFEVGDWIEVDGVKGQVTDISWRSTRLRVSGNDVVVIPNLIISDNSVYNYTAEDISYRDELTLGFSYGDPPNKVKQIMMDVLQDCPDVMKLPAPRIFTVSYDDFSIGYKLYYYVKVYASAMDQERIRDDIMSRVWYAADRGGLSIPFPINVEGPPAVFEPDLSKIQKGVYEFLSQNRYFSSLSKETLTDLAAGTEITPFAIGETIFKEGEISASVGLIRKGEILLYNNDAPKAADVEHARPDDLVNEIALLGRRASPVAARATEDTELLIFTLEQLNPIIEQNPKFARRLNAFIEMRLMQVKQRRAS